MSADGGPARSTEERFELQRFAWATPDRLELAGTFAGLGDVPREAPVLVIHGTGRMHRLPAVPESLSGAPEDGQPWRAAFAWQEPPEPFTAAELELGAIAVPLPDPSSEREAPEPLPVRRPPPADGAARIALEAELLTAREQIRALRLDAERDRGELERARQALEAERERRAGDSERFRAGVAQVRATAEETVGRLSAELSEALAERDALRERIVELETEVGQSGAALASLTAVRDDAVAAAGDAERLLVRMQSLRDALGGES